MPIQEGTSIDASALNTELGALETEVNNITAGYIKKNSLRAEQIPSALPVFGNVEPLTGGKSSTDTLTFAATGSANRQPVTGMTLTWAGAGFTVNSTDSYGAKAILVLCNIDSSIADMGGTPDTQVYYALEYDDGVSWNLISRTERRGGGARLDPDEYQDVSIRTLLTPADVTDIVAIRLTCWVGVTGDVITRDGNITALPLYCEVV